MGTRILKLSINTLILSSLIFIPVTQTPSKTDEVAYINVFRGGRLELHLIDAQQGTPSSQKIVTLPRGQEVEQIFTDTNNWVGLQLQGGEGSYSAVLINSKTGQLQELMSSDFIFASSTFSTTGTQNFTWSPDGKFLAFVGSQSNSISRAYLYSTTTKTVKIIDAKIAEIFQVIWSQDSNKVIVEGETCRTDYNNCLYKVEMINIFDQTVINSIDISSTAPTSLGNDLAFCNLTLSPNQQYLSYVSGCDATAPYTEKELYLWDIQNNRVKKITTFTEIPLKSPGAIVGAVYYTSWYSSNELLVSSSLSIDYILYSQIALYNISQSSLKTIVLGSSARNIAINPVSRSVAISGLRQSLQSSQMGSIKLIAINFSSDLKEFISVPSSCSLQWSDDGLTLVSLETNTSDCQGTPQKLKFLTSSRLNEKEYDIPLVNEKPLAKTVFLGWVN